MRRESASATPTIQSFHRYSGPTEAACITNDEHESNALNYSPVIYISSAEEDELESSVENTNPHAGEKERNGIIPAEYTKTADQRADNSNGHSPGIRNSGECSKKFGSSNAMSPHGDNDHGNEKKICCHLCKRTLKNNTTLKRHIRFVHSHRERFQCSVASCCRELSTMTCLRRHMNAMHTKQISFKCSMCSFQTYYRSNLRRHQQKQNHRGYVYLLS